MSVRRRSRRRVKGKSRERSRRRRSSRRALYRSSDAKAPKRPKVAATNTHEIEILAEHVESIGPLIKLINKQINRHRNVIQSFVSQWNAAPTRTLDEAGVSRVEEITRVVFGHPVIFDYIRSLVDSDPTDATLQRVGTVLDSRSLDPNYELLVRLLNGFAGRFTKLFEQTQVESNSGPIYNRKLKDLLESLLDTLDVAFPTVLEREILSAMRTLTYVRERYIGYDRDMAQVVVTQPFLHRGPTPFLYRTDDTIHDVLSKIEGANEPCVFVSREDGGWTIVHEYELISDVPQTLVVSPIFKVVLDKDNYAALFAPTLFHALEAITYIRKEKPDEISVDDIDKYGSRIQLNAESKENRAKLLSALLTRLVLPGDS